jgi:hypothetical protein
MRHFRVILLLVMLVGGPQSEYYRNGNGNIIVIGEQSMSRWVLPAGLTLAAIFALQPVSVSAQSIGSAAAVRPEAHGGGSTLQTGSSLYANETVGTGQAGQAELQFLDSTKLSVGPSSSVRLDKFVYDPNNKGAGKVAINATKGAYRFITGEQDKKNYEIKTPYATLGVRGTVLEIVIVPGKGKGKARRASTRTKTRTAYR